MPQPDVDQIKEAYTNMMSALANGAAAADHISTGELTLVIHTLIKHGSAGAARA